MLDWKRIEAPGHSKALSVRLTFCQAKNIMIHLFSKRFIYDMIKKTQESVVSETYEFKKKIHKRYWKIFEAPDYMYGIHVYKKTAWIIFFCYIFISVGSICRNINMYIWKLTLWYMIGIHIGQGYTIFIFATT